MINPPTIDLIRRFNDPARNSPLSDKELLLLRDRIQDMGQVLREINLAHMGLIVSFDGPIDTMLANRGVKIV